MKIFLGRRPSLRHMLECQFALTSSCVRQFFPQCIKCYIVVFVVFSVTCWCFCFSDKRIIIGDTTVLVF